MKMPVCCDRNSLLPIASSSSQMHPPSAGEYHIVVFLPDPRRPHPNSEGMRLAHG